MSALLFWGTAIPAGLALGLVIANMASDWMPFRRHHSDAYWCSRWSWLGMAPLASPCYHETPDGPRCCNCGLKPPKEKAEHGNKIKE